MDELNPKLWPNWVNTLEEVKELIAQFEEVKNVKFSVLGAKRRKFGNSDITEKSHYVLFEDKKLKNQRIPLLGFDGIPFIAANTLTLDCSHGIDRKKGFKEKRKQLCKEQDDLKPNAVKRRHLILDTKKVDCPAKIVVREIIKFPDYYLPDNTSWKRREMSKKLRNDFLTEVAVGETRFYIIVPEDCEHKNHSIRSSCSTSRPTPSTTMDDRIRDKIYKLVQKGIINLTQVKRHLFNFVKSGLFLNSEIPEKTNRRYFPYDEDIQQCVKSSLLCHRINRIDDESVGYVIQKYKYEYPDDKVFYCSSLQYTTEGTQSIVLIFQSKEQQRLLQMYGNHICMLDAVYKSMNYVLPLYFLQVKTNVDYQPVGSFILLDENVDSISAALSILKQWNHTWNPKYFLLNFVENEIDALQMVFPDTEIYISDFHRELLWQKWVRLTVNIIVAKKDDVLKYLNDIASAATEMQFYNMVHELQNSKVWECSKKLRNYFSRIWLPKSSQWARAFRSQEFLVLYQTNNGLETFSKAVKHSCLGKHREQPLSSLLGILFHEYLPEKYLSYVSIQSNSRGLEYTALPDYLSKATSDVAKHCMNQIENSCNIFAESVEEIEPAVFSIKGLKCTNKIDFGNDAKMPHCDCKDWEKHYLPCSHFFLVSAYTEYTWSHINPLLTNVYWKIDETCLSMTVTAKSGNKSIRKFSKPNDDFSLRQLQSIDNEPEGFEVEWPGSLQEEVEIESRSVEVIEVSWPEIEVKSELTDSEAATVLVEISNDYLVDVTNGNCGFC